MMNDYGKILANATVFQRQIRRKQAEAGCSWTWEAYFPGPLSKEEAELIMAIAGCWCDDPSEENVRFYTNQNHPRWSFARQFIY